jgi:hypothetical protein
VEYEYHPESKCDDVNGNPCSKQTIGLLQRRHVRIEQIKPIGKESNSLEEVESSLIHAEQSVYTEYPDPAIPQREAAKNRRPSVLLDLGIDEMAEEIRMTFCGPISGKEACRYSPERQGRSGGGTERRADRRR